MSTLYIRLPARAAAEHIRELAALTCSFALAADGGSIEREGAAPLSDLAAAIGKAQRVVVLIAAGDVTLLRVDVPPLSAARLKVALPNLVEDQLMSDPAECVIVAGSGAADGSRTVAVVHRDWLETVAEALFDLGARNIAALPAQLCLPDQPGMVSAAVMEQEIIDRDTGEPGVDIELTLRLSEQEGIGLSILPEPAESPGHNVLQALRAVVPATPIALYVPASKMALYETVISVDSGITVLPDNWTRWIGGAKNVQLNLMAGLRSGAEAATDWRAWRWPLALAGALIAVNAAALNVDWWRLKREADNLQAGMTQAYKSLYPKETAILDPVAQMRQKIVAAQRQAGQPAPDDFAALAAVFGEIWNNAMQAQGGGTGSAIAGLEYKDRALLVRLKVDASSLVEPVKAALAARNLSLSVQAGDAWQIRSVK